MNNNYHLSKISIRVKSIYDLYLVLGMHVSERKIKYSTYNDQNNPI